MADNKVTVHSDLGDIKSFASMITGRKSIIESAGTTPLKKTYNVNAVAKALHPEVQHLIIKNAADLGGGVRSFLLAPDESRGTRSLAYFKAGQYLSITMKIGESIVTRPFSIASPPSRALSNEYLICVKRERDGFASEFIFNNWRKGTRITASAPEGHFTYEPVRDCKTVVGIAGGSGVTPFLSLAGAINDGTEDLELVLFYGARKLSDAVFKGYLDSLAEKCSKIKVICVLSDERMTGCERGFITRGLIARYAPPDYSVFVCGPASLYKFASNELASMNLERRKIRFEMFGEIKNPASVPGFPEKAKGKTFICTVIKDGEVLAGIPAFSEESIAVALERSGIPSGAVCRSGECGYCRCVLKAGDVFIPKAVDKRRRADILHGVIHPCCTFPAGDITVEL